MNGSGRRTRPRENRDARQPVARFLRFLTALALAGLGWGAGALLAPWIPVLGWAAAWVGALVGLGIGVLAARSLARAPSEALARRFQQVSTATLLLGTGGMLVGLVAGALLSVPMGLLPGAAGSLLPTGVTLLLAGAGAVVAVSRERDFAEAFPWASKLRRPSGPGERLILVDTSVIIDGRIADLVQTGFLMGTLAIPRFVLDELRHIADSSDPLRRNRGRRGLEVLNRLRKESPIPVQILDADGRNGTEVDSRLVRLARQLNASILTNDYNLNRVAQVQGVQVLNINALVNALKPVVLPGEEMVVRVIQEGKEPGQGVGFMDDGTMVVVEGGRPYINSFVDVVVTRVLQTGTGRIIFAQPKEEARADG